jgi:hypothetical protein
MYRASYVENTGLMLSPKSNLGSLVLHLSLIERELKIYPSILTFPPSLFLPPFFPFFVISKVFTK